VRRGESATGSCWVATGFWYPEIAAGFVHWFRALLVVKFSCLPALRFFWTFDML